MSQRAEAFQPALEPKETVGSLPTDQPNSEPLKPSHQEITEYNTESELSVYTYITEAIETYKIPYQDIAKTLKNLPEAFKHNPEHIRTLFTRAKFAPESPPTLFFKRLNQLYGEDIIPEEPTKLYPDEATIPPSIKGEHLERPFEQRTKIRLYNSSDPEQYLRFCIGGGAGKIFSDPTTTLVNYYESGTNIKKQGMLGGYPDYVISQVDESPKRSHYYRNCTTIIIIGENEAGKQVSFLTHQNPNCFFTGKKNEFQADIGLRIREIVQQCKPGSIDISILGGNYYTTVDQTHQGPTKLSKIEQYNASIKELKSMIKEEFTRAGQKTPPVIALTGPDFSSSSSESRHTDIVLDTQARIVLASRPKQFHNLTNEIYDSSNHAEYQARLDKVKDLFPQVRPVSISNIVTEQIELLKSTSAQDLTPEHERSIHNTLKSLHIPTFNDIRRDSNNRLVVDVTGGDINILVVYGDFSQQLKETKMTEMTNFETITIQLLKDLKIMAEAGLTVHDSENSFLYTINAHTHKMSYLVGGLKGYMYIENNSDKSKEDIYMANIGAAVDSLQSFLDSYMHPHMIPIYSKLFRNLVNEALAQNIPAAQYESITGHL